MTPDPQTLPGPMTSLPPAPSSPTKRRTAAVRRSVPHPTGGTLYLRLRADRGTVAQIKG
jgi:hypothetical protein